MSRDHTILVIGMEEPSSKYTGHIVSPEMNLYICVGLQVVSPGHYEIGNVPACFLVAFKIE